LGKRVLILSVRIVVHEKEFTRRRRNERVESRNVRRVKERKRITLRSD
jgi:hypothetical protein